MTTDEWCHAAEKFVKHFVMHLVSFSQHKEIDHASSIPFRRGSRLLRHCRPAGPGPAALSCETGEDHRALRGGRARGHLRARHRREALGRARPVVRHRGQAGRRLDRRHRRRGKERARRLYAADDVEHAHGERIADPRAAVRADARLHPGRSRELFRPRPRGASFRQRAHAQGLYRSREGQAGRSQLCVLGIGHALPHGRRTLQSLRRRGHRACAATREARARAPTSSAGRSR